MMINKKISAFGLTSALLLSATAAFAEGESVETQQKTLLQKLDSLNAAVLGLKLNGTAKAGGLTSMAASDNFAENSPTQENQAYSDVNLVLTARPSSETQVHLEMRLHKDWQSAFDENNNPMIGHWFSYDGKILDKHVDFNLGYMRVGFTPYTLYTPQQLLLQEPEVFAEKRVEALAQRNLDTTSNRLMQGLNVDYHSGQLGILSDVHAQVTGSRMRNTAKKQDQVFFDFDYSDRYFYGLRAGVEAFGANIGVNYTDVFDRHLSTESRITTKDTVTFEDNSVISAELGFDSKNILPSLPVRFGVNAEVAMSNWSADREYLVADKDTTFDIQWGDVGGDSIMYLVPYYKVKNVLKNEDLGSAEDMGLYIEPYINLDVAGVGVDVKGLILSNGKDFWSEMASSPVYRGNSVVLNANALYKNDSYTSLVDQFGMSSLENMYFSVYNSNPLNVTNLMSSGTSENALSNKEEDNKYFYTRVYNNYKNAHFYRNGYKADAMKKYEIEQALINLDPSGSMDMPYGVATPDRQGFRLSIDANWNEAVEFNAIFSMMTESAAVQHNAFGAVVSDLMGNTVYEENNYMHYGAGLGVDFGRLFPSLNRTLKLQFSYDHTEEDAFLQRSSSRIMGGLSADIYGPISFLAGYNSSVKEFGKPLAVTETASITKAEEMLILAGPRVKIAPNSYISVQYGLLTDAVSLQLINELGMPVNDKLSIDKNVIVADVTVNF